MNVQVLSGKVYIQSESYFLTEFFKKSEIRFYISEFVRGIFCAIFMLMCLYMMNE